MKVRRALITAAGRRQRALPLQSLIDRDGVERSLLHILLNEVVGAGIDDIGIVVRPGDESRYAEVAGEHAGRIHFLLQDDARGYADAIYQAREFCDDAPFLHLVGDHLYVSRGETSCARQLVTVAEAQNCSISAVQPTRESLLPLYGAVGGQLLPGHDDLYRIDTVLEKPTPTTAEQRLLVPGLRAGHYLCFFGMHVFTPVLMEVLGALLADEASFGIPLSPALDRLARREQYLALNLQGQRFDVGVPYGLLSAQMALALNGSDRDEVLSRLLELLAQNTLHSDGVRR